MSALYAAISMVDDTSATSPVAQTAPTNPAPAAGGAAAAPPPPKKPRTHQACEICRDRKTKCTGERPSCAQCIKRGIPCSYDRKATPRRSDGLLQIPRQQPQPHQLMMARPSNYDRPYQHRASDSDIVIVDSDNSARFRQYASDPQDHHKIEARTSIKRPLESDRSDDFRAPAVPYGPRPVASPEQRRVPSFTPIQAAGHRAFASPPAAEPSRPPSAVQPPRVQQTPTPAPEENGVYGLSNNTAFISKLSGESSASAPISAVLGQRRPHTLQTKQPERLTQSTASHMDGLPRRSRADDFLRCYWDFMHPLFPLLHRESFMTRYLQLWTEDVEEPSTEFEENMFMSALHLVFAIGCRFSTLISDDQKLITAEEYYQRSRQTFNYDILDTNSLSMIQLLLLQVTYLASTPHAIRCWNAIGLAIRASQSCGIHIEDPNQHGQLQVEMKRRIWHTCITLDRLVAMVFGRPATVQSTDLPLPSLIDDEYIRDSTPGRQPEGQIPQLGLFVYSIKLLDVLQDVLTTFYPTSNNSPSQTLRLQVPGSKANNSGQLYDIVSSVTSFAKRIDAVERDIPAWLLTEPNEYTEPHVRLQQRVLRVRLYYIRLLAMRPLLLYAPSRDRSGRSYTLEDDIAAVCCQRCVETSKSLINYTLSNLSDLHRSSPWHTTIYTCAALSVFLAALKLGQVAWDDPELHKSWDAAISILEAYQESVQAAAEGIQVLQRLKRKLQSTLKKTQDGTADSQYSTPLSIQDLSGVSLGIDDINDAWFSQHFLDTNWIETMGM